ncbi:16074_t:CDS:1, partial [Racocetra fulgida]
MFSEFDPIDIIDEDIYKDKQIDKKIKDSNNNIEIYTHLNLNTPTMKG